MIQYQILLIEIIRNVCQTVKRITNEILGVFYFLFYFIFFFFSETYLLLFSPKTPRLNEGDYNISNIKSIYSGSHTNRHINDTQIAIATQRLTKLGMYCFKQLNNGLRAANSVNYKTLYFAKKKHG